jgi:hypothetical protein
VLPASTKSTRAVWRARIAWLEASPRARAQRWRRRARRARRTRRRRRGAWARSTAIAKVDMRMRRGRTRAGSVIPGRTTASSGGRHAQTALWGYTLCITARSGMRRV